MRLTMMAAVLAFGLAAGEALAQECAGIDIVLTAGETAGTSRIAATGCTVREVHGSDLRDLGARNPFNPICSAGGPGILCGRYGGARPHAVGLKIGDTNWETPSGNPWEGTPHRPRLIVRPVKAEILGIDIAPEVVARRTFDNSRAAESHSYSATISTTVTQSQSHEWSASLSVGMSQSVSWEVGGDAYGGKVGGETEMHWEASIGTSESHESSLQLGTADTVTAEVPAGMVREASLGSARGTLRARVTYEVSIEGRAHAWWGRGGWDGNWAWFGDGRSSQRAFHHFLPLDLILQASGGAPSRTLEETVEVGFYTSGTLAVSDSRQGGQ